MKGIDPKWAMYLGLLVTIEQAIGHGTVSLTNLVPESWAPYITSWCNFLAFVGTAIMTYQAAVSAPLPGPAANTSIAPTATVVKVLLIAFALSFLVAGGSAMAQVKLKTPGQIVRDIQNTVAGKPQQATDTSGNPIVSLLSKPMQDLADFISAGFTEAVSLSTAVPELQDGNGQACWAMMNNYSAVLKAHPIPLTLHAAADLESIRLLNMAANKICQNSACTQVFTDAGNLVNAALPIGMPLPNLTAICSKVPEIAIVSPTLPIVPLPVAAPAPVATPPAQ